MKKLVLIALVLALVYFAVYVVAPGEQYLYEVLTLVGIVVWGVAKAVAILRGAR